MESKRPQLEQVLSTAKDLQNQNMSETDRKILKDRGKGKKMCKADRKILKSEIIVR